MLDLFSGLRGWSDPWKERGHEVITLDLDPKFKADLVMDIRDLTPDMLPWKPDVILASPPCEAFSVMQIGRCWTKNHLAKTTSAEEALDIVSATLALVRLLDPAVFVMENPRAKLRRLVEVHWPYLERRTVTYCQYGEERMKPTDLWSDRWPAALELIPPCHNGDPCHIRAVRGSTTGTQGMDRAVSAKIPAPLSLAILDSIETDMEVVTWW